MSAVENFLSLLRSRDGHMVRRSGSQWTARCPAHDDRSPSMWIKEGDDGRVLLGCRAGCSSKAIIDALGAPWSVLFDSFLGEKPFVPKPARRNSESSSPPLARQDIEDDWDAGLLSTEAYLRELDAWNLGVFPRRSRVELSFDEFGEVSSYRLRPLPLPPMEAA